MLGLGRVRLHSIYGKNLHVHTAATNLVHLLHNLQMEPASNGGAQMTAGNPQITL
jgi:hypothetical protein